MQQTSIKKNFVYKSILTISTYIIGFITFPYISRIFGVEKLGLVNFVDNTINYFLLFATMGIALIGVREIAAVKNNQNKLNLVFSNILGLNIIFTLFTLVVYYGLIKFIPTLNQYAFLFYIGAAKIFFSAFIIEWFFSGIEDFRYITIRSIIIKILYVVSVFIFVKHQNDYILYFVLTVLTIVVNASINILYVRRYVKIRIVDLFSLKYFKSNITIGVCAIMSSMYLTFNVIYLGFVSNNIQVGYYSTAFKLYSVILGFFSAYTNVVMPRMSVLLAYEDNNTFIRLIERSLSIIIGYSVPIVMYTVVMASDIICLISGNGYEGAVLPMRIIMPAILFVGIAQVIAIQLLMPLKKDNILMGVTIIGAILSIVMNVTLTAEMKSIGSALILLLSELIVTISYLLYIGYIKIIVFPYKEMLLTIFVYLPFIPLSFVICNYCGSPIIRLFLTGLLIGVYVIIVNKLTKGKYFYY